MHEEDKLEKEDARIVQRRQDDLVLDDGEEIECVSSLAHVLTKVRG